MNDHENSHGHHFENHLTDLENAVQSLARDYDASRIFQDGLEQRLRQIEARLDAMDSLHRSIEDRLRAYDNLAKEGLHISAIERRMDMLGRRHQGVNNIRRREGPLSPGIPPANSAFVHEQGPPTVGRGHFGSGRKR